MEKTYWNLLTLRGVNDIVQIDEQEKNLCQKKTYSKILYYMKKGLRQVRIMKKKKTVTKNLMTLTHTGAGVIRVKCLFQKDIYVG